MSGNDLLQKLTDKDTAGLHYLIGIVDGAEASRLIFTLKVIQTDEDTRRKAEASLGKFWGCRPEKATYGQVVDVTVAYLKNIPICAILNLQCTSPLQCERRGHATNFTYP